MHNEELCDQDGGRAEGCWWNIWENFLFLFLGAFAKLRKATISFDVSVCLSIRIGKLGSHRKDFHEIYLSIFRKPVEKIKVLLKSDKGNRYFT